MIRFFDILFSLLGLIILSPIIILLIFLGIIENGSPIFRQKRVGINQIIFFLLKFRTMHKNTKSTATHFVDFSKVTSFGLFLRSTKLDEIPQLFNVLMGDMSLVGPRPSLFSQRKLIIERNKRGIFKVKPGITGLAQISGINMKTPTLLAKTDFKMIKKLNLSCYFYYIFMTFFVILKK